MFLANALQKQANEILFLHESVKGASEFNFAPEVKNNSELLKLLLPYVRDGEIAPDPREIAVKLYAEAVELYNQVLAGSWDKRCLIFFIFPRFEN